MFEKAKSMSDIANWGENTMAVATARFLNLRANTRQLAITDADLGRGFHMRRVRSSNSLMLICHGGQVLVKLDRWPKPRRLTPGQAVYIPRGHFIDYRCLDGHRFAHFGLEWHDPVQAPRYDADHPQVSSVDTVTFRHAYEALCREIASGHDDEATRSCWDTCHHIASRAVGGERPASPMLALRLELERRLAHHWTNDEMAGLLNLSGSSLRRLCLAQTGRAPMQYLADLRMRHAAEMLRMTPATVADVAEQVGYDSPFAFSKAFTRHHGESPAAYRRS